MLKLYILIQAAILGLESRTPRHGEDRHERGSVTIEHVGWAVAVIAIVAIVVAAIKAYVTNQSGKLQ